MHILIVDDHPTNRKLLRTVLDGEALEISEAKDGAEALAVIASKPIDAVICDILMPTMDGYRFCYELRRDPRFIGLPVVLYTSTYTTEADRTLGIRMGADIYLTKPAPAKTIMAAIREAIEKSRRRKALAAARNGDTTFVMREYNEVLVKKLEEKNADLERAQSELLETNRQLMEKAAALAELNAGLEERVKQRTAELREQNERLTAALAEVKELSGLLPICAWCKKIRDGENYWHAVESYVSRHSKAEFTHGICPTCLDKQTEELKKL